MVAKVPVEPLRNLDCQMLRQPDHDRAVGLQPAPPCGILRSHCLRHCRSICEMFAGQPATVRFLAQIADRHWNQGSPGGVCRVELGLLCHSMSSHLQDHMSIGMLFRSRGNDVRTMGFVMRRLAYAAVIGLFPSALSEF